MVLEQRLAQMLLDRQDKNSILVDMFFERPGFKNSLTSYLGGTYDEFRQEMVGS